MAHKWLRLSIMPTLMFVITAAVLFALNVPVLYAELQRICDTCALTPSVKSDLPGIGLTPAKYAVYLLFLSTSFAIGSVILGGLIVRKRPSDPMALLVALTLTTFGLSLTVTEPFKIAYPMLSVAATIIGFVSINLMVAVFCYFPDFRAAPRWSHYLAAAYFLTEASILLLPIFLKEPNALEWLMLPIQWVLLLLMGVTQVYRYFRISTPLQRQQTKLPAFTFLFSVIIIISSVQIPQTYVIGNLASQTVYMMGISLIPISFAYAIIRHRLWFIDPLINRTFLYGTLTAVLLALYSGVIFILSESFQTEKSTFISLTGTVVVAVTVHPLHKRLQLLINRLTYGDRLDPHAALVRLGDRLEANSSPNSILDAIVFSIKDALRVPFVCLIWPDGLVASESGTFQQDLHSIDVFFQGEKVAVLNIASRDKEDVWSKEDLQLISNLARQAGPAIHSIRLTHELQQSRRKLVTTREDERRRLRRDLHDGLGPEIAAFSFRIAAARNLLHTNPNLADNLLNELQMEIRNAVNLIRRLAYNLRPPALDEYGLGPSITEMVQRHKDAGGDIQLRIPTPLPQLDAAVEVATYLIVQEGLTNALRHANASEIYIEMIFKEDKMNITIGDNGTGFSQEKRIGVGLISMRERAEELGGSVFISSSPNGGTIIQCQIPNIFRSDDDEKIQDPIG